MILNRKLLIEFFYFNQNFLSFASTILDTWSAPGTGLSDEVWNNSLEGLKSAFNLSDKAAQTLNENRTFDIYNIKEVTEQDLII